jgi:hypothetical protein
LDALFITAFALHIVKRIDAVFLLHFAHEIKKVRCVGERDCFDALKWVFVVIGGLFAFSSEKEIILVLVKIYFVY